MFRIYFIQCLKLMLKTFQLNFLNSCYLQMCQINFSNEMFMKSELTSLFYQHHCSVIVLRLNTLFLIAKLCFGPSHNLV